jgi:hypothetical protein
VRFEQLVLFMSGVRNLRLIDLPLAVAKRNNRFQLLLDYPAVCSFLRCAERLRLVPHWLASLIM